MRVAPHLFFFAMQFKVEKIKIVLECDIKDRQSAENIVDKLSEHRHCDLRDFKGGRAALTYYNANTFLFPMVEIGENIFNYKEAVHIPCEPHRVLNILSSKPLYNLVVNCRINLMANLPEDRWLMSKDDMNELFDSIQGTGAVKINPDYIGGRFNSDVPSKRTKLLFSKGDLVVLAGSGGLYRFYARFNYNIDNFCIKFIHRLHKLTGAHNKSSKFGKGVEYVEEPDY